MHAGSIFFNHKDHLSSTRMKDNNNKKKSQKKKKKKKKREWRSVNDLKEGMGR